MCRVSAQDSQHGSGAHRGGSEVEDERGRLVCKSSRLSHCLKKRGLQVRDVSGHTLGIMQTETINACSMARAHPHLLFPARPTVQQYREDAKQCMCRPRLGQGWARRVLRCP